jgi:ubiquinone/menaquinone biosynthesis C-methylase UbiE
MSKDTDTVQQVRKVFDTVAPRYDNPAMRYFPFCANRLVYHLQPEPGSKVLDVATGTGVVSLAVAQAIGPHGRVQAIDLSENMLAVATRNLQGAGLDNVDFHLMDARRLDFKSRYFDTVTCSFGIFFLPDMLAGLREWQRVLKPGGRLMFTTFTANAFQPLAEHFRHALETQGQVIEKESWMRLTDPADAMALLEAAGFDDRQYQVEQLGYHLNDPEDWWDIILSSGFRGYVDRLDPAGQQALRRLHLTEVQKLMTDKGLWLDVEVCFVSGRRTT